jgi:predicted nucleotidyltransferase
MVAQVKILRIDGPEPQSSLINRLTGAFAKDERILACWLRGSFAAGTTDKYSDIDMAISVKDEQFHQAFEAAQEITKSAGEKLVAWNSPKDVNGAGFTCFYSDCNFLDLKIYRASRTGYQNNAPARVLFDRKGLIRPRAGPEREEHLGPPLNEQVKWKMVYFWICAYSAIRFLKREEFWYAAGMINAIRGTLAQLFWLWKHPGELTDMSFVVWGVVRRDLDSELQDELASTVGKAEKAELVSALGKLMDIFERYARRIADETGAEYPEKLVEVVRGFYRREFE